MRLKSLEMTGFKSFAERTALEFVQAITAVVGPNGCGKSNIVDGLRWVMGEQSPRHLRGQQMEDIIFNGSESLAPTGMAEVSLILDNEDGRGPAEYGGFSEIMITRRLFRSGESEYAINKIPCRLKDIIELFLGTGIGNKAYSIVEQGRVDEMVNAKPEERRALIEEAAGTSKYKSRKLMAERKLERTHQNLLRVNDIVREIERQIRGMELQAKKAERYKSVKKELQGRELAWASVQRKRFEDEIAGLEGRARALEDRLVELVASLHGKESESEQIRLSLLETEKEIQVHQESVYQQKVQIQRDEQKVGFCQSDRGRLRDAEKRTREELLQTQQRIRDMSLEIEQLRNARENFVQLSLFEEAFRKDKEQELEKAKSQAQALRSELERDKETLIDTANQISHLKNDLLAREKQREAIGVGLARTQKETADTSHSLASCKEKQQEKNTAWTQLLAQIEETQRKGSETAEYLRGATKLKEGWESALADLKARTQEARSRLASLEDLQKNYEGYQDGVRAIMLRRRQERALEGVYGLVADVIDAPESYEKALTAVLGERLQYMIVRGHEEGVEAIEYLKRESSGRGSFVPRQLYRREARLLPLKEPEAIAPLLQVISVKEDYKDVAEFLLGDVVIVRDLKSGLDLWHRNGFQSTLVTPEGEVIDSMGVVTGGSAGHLEGSLLSQRRRIKELENLLSELEAERWREEKALEALRAEMAGAEARQSECVMGKHRLELERIRLEHERLQADQEVDRLKELLETLTQEQTDLSTSDESLVEAMRECRVGMDSRSQEKLQREKALEEKQRSLSELDHALSRLEAETTESRIRGAALTEKKEHAHLDFEGRVRMQEELNERVRSQQSDLAQVEQRGKQLEEELALVEQSLEHGKRALQDLEATLENHRSHYREVSRRVTEIEEAVKEMRPSVEAAHDEKSRIQVSLSEKRLSLQHLSENIREKYSLDLNEVCVGEPDQELNEDQLFAEIEELRGRLERMGEVNLAAIGEFEDLNSRFQFLSQQKQDLETSIADLQRTIAKLNRVCRLRFKESFEEINQRFETIFPRLFRGGKARLVLTDENDYLETGVEIIAQPPGKKLQSVTLLSGGEKALTAVSLLFAIFLTKPGPFCFLDEVDAPLDDANIDRFNEMIKEMSQTSQFILISHNKRTMQSAEVLYGITMAEPGVSKVVSVRMN